MYNFKLNYCSKYYSIILTNILFFIKIIKCFISGSCDWIIYIKCSPGRLKYLIYLYISFYCLNNLNICIPK